MAYRIQDEPSPGGAAHLAVNPVWPLLAVMFGGAGLSWPWFMLNGFALGSPTRRQELAWAIGGLVGSLLLVQGIDYLGSAGVIGQRGAPYAWLGLIVWKLAVSYWLYMLQARSFHLYEHFGGQVRNGALILILGYILTRQLLSMLPAWWYYALR